MVVVRILIAAPKSTEAFGKEYPLIFTVTIVFPGSSYFTGASLPNSKSDKVPTTWTIGLVVILLFGFFVHNYLMVFTQMGISWIAWRSGIFIQKIFSSPKRSKSGCSIGRGMISHSRNGGEEVVSCS